MSNVQCNQIKMSILDAMSRIQPLSELNSTYTFDHNSSGQLQWKMDTKFREFRLPRGFGEYYSDLADFLFDQRRVFEFCLLVEGCKNHGIAHGYEWCERRVANTLDKVRGLNLA